MTMTNTCDGAGEGEGDGEGDGDGDGTGEGVREGLGRAVDGCEHATVATMPSAITTDLRSPVVRLRGGPWEMELRPERGGRITSLTLRGEELLDQGIGVDDPGAEQFVAGGAAGWDEMIPNLEPCVYPGPGWPDLQLPDHGEAWRLAWRVESQTDSSVTMSVAGRLLPWTLERRLELMPDRVRATYVWGNAGEQSLHAYWCCHPLFKYEPGMRIGLPGVSRLEALATGTSEKMFIEPGTVDRVSLRWASGTAVEFAWDGKATPYTGIWACNGDLGGYRQIAVEPATGGRDRPDLSQPPPYLHPRETIDWWIEIRTA